MSNIKYHFYRFMCNITIGKIKRFFQYKKNMSKTNIVYNRGENNKFIVLDSQDNELHNYQYIKNLSVKFNGNNNLVILYENINLTKSLNIVCSSNNILKIGRTNNPVNITLTDLCENCKLIIGNDLTSYGVHIPLHDSKGMEVNIGNSCLFAGQTEIRAYDGHSIIDNCGNILNSPENITIGNHCWIGVGSMILKGSIIPDNSVLGAKSLYTKRTNPNDLQSGIFVGVPAKRVRKDINWDIRNFDTLSQIMPVNK